MKANFGPPVPQVMKTQCPNCHVKIWTTHRGTRRCTGCYTNYDIAANELDVIVTRRHDETAR